MLQQGAMAVDEFAEVGAMKLEGKSGDFHVYRLNEHEESQA